MKLKQLSFLPLLVLTLPMLGQTLTAIANPTGSNKMEFKVVSIPLIKQNTTNLWNPMYWGFWIFGDGEYAPTHLRPYWNKYPAPSHKLTSPAPAPPATDHIFPPGAAASYNAASFFIPRKGDDPFPGFVTNATVSVPSGTATLTRQKLLLDGRKIYLEHSQGYYQYKGEKSAFAITYNPEGCMDGGQVLLFYNSELKPSLGPTPETIFLKLPPLTDFNIPNYGFTPPFSTLWQDSKIFDTSKSSSTTFQNEFQDVFIWPFSPTYISKARSSPSGVGAEGELRIFPSLETYAAPNDNNPAYALAILTSQCSIPPYPDPTRLRHILSNVIPTALTTNPIKIGESWVVDADTIFLKSGEPVDPNTLVIKEICPCPREKNRYKVTFLLTYRNTGTAPASKVVIHINSLHHFFAFCEILGVKDEGSTHSWESPNKLTVKMKKGKKLRIGKSAEITFTMIASNLGLDLGSLHTLLHKEVIVGGDVYFDSYLNDKEPFINKRLFENGEFPFITNPCKNCCVGKK